MHRHVFGVGSGRLGDLFAEHLEGVVTQLTIVDGAQHAPGLSVVQHHPFRQQRMLDLRQRLEAGIDRLTKRESDVALERGHLDSSCGKGECRHQSENQSQEDLSHFVFP